jgi:SAM-dependent methyltransferase
MPFVAHRVFGWEPVEIDDSWGLRTIRNGHAYSICNTLHCLECGLLFLDIRFTEDEMKALYSDYRGEAYTTLRERYEPGYRARNDDLNAGIRYLPQVEAFLSPFLPERIRVLDWGGDTGTNTPFKERAELFHVYDISAKSAVPGATIVDMETVRRTAYDLIVCSNVLEHVSYPVDLLADIKARMTEGTILYIEVPYEEVVRLHADSPGLASRKRHWHEHINFFGQVSTGRMVRAAGLEILALEDLGCVPGDELPHQFMIACRLPS